MSDLDLNSHPNPPPPGAYPLQLLDHVAVARLKVRLKFDHEKKIWPDPFKAVVDGRKPFEVRKFEEAWLEGESLLLREWNPKVFEESCRGAHISPKVPAHVETERTIRMREKANADAYTGQSVAVVVTYVVGPGKWGLPLTLIVFGIKPLTM